jgi:hypothetical protein
MSDLNEMIEYTKQWKQWLEHASVRAEDREGKENLLKQMDAALQKWSKELNHQEKE